MPSVFTLIVYVGLKNKNAEREVLFVNVLEDLSGPLAIQCVWFVEANVLPSIFFPPTFRM